MLGQMMKMPLLISSLIDNAAKNHSDTKIVSVETAGGIARRDWGQTALQARKLASALGKMGLAQSARVGTLAWNNYRHLEIYFGASGGGFVCHTINPRLFAEQLVFVVNDAQDQVLFLEETFVPIIAAIQDQLPTLKAIVLMGPRNEAASAQIAELQFYDELVETGDAAYTWPELDEDLASSLCYTSGTTGNPKGVLYSHRSTVLHAFGASLPDSLNISARSVLLPVVPMFHVNAWGVPYAAAMTGASLVMPGPNLDGASLVALIEGEGVTCALGVPTIWQGLLAAAKAEGAKLENLQTTVIGGSACPPAMIETFHKDFNVETIHAWGMTEISPLGTVNQLLAKHADLPEDEKLAVRLSQGRPVFGVDMVIHDEEGAVLPNDGAAQGKLMVRGHWVVDSYFGAEPATALEGGWFDTGDIATLDADSYLTIRDRSKDVIKSGGEWISSVELEGIAIGHDELADAGIIGAFHEKWDERPVLIAVKAEGYDPDEKTILEWFKGRIAAWQIPDKVVFVESLPRNATGKILKNKLRDDWADVLTKGEKKNG